jgi:hypothetical protein
MVGQVLIASPNKPQPLPSGGEKANYDEGFPRFYKNITMIILMDS